LRTWRAFLAWAAAASFDPRSLSFPTALETYGFLGEGKNAASLKQIRAALSFAYKHWDLKNPFATIDPPLHKEPKIRYLLLADIRRLLGYLKSRQNGYGSALAFHLANALFQTACRFDELIQLTWADCQAVGKEIVALRIKGKGSVFQDVPVPGRLSAALLEWKAFQEDFKGRRILAPGGIAFAGSQFVFAGYSGSPFSNRAFRFDNANANVSNRNVPPVTPFRDASLLGFPVKKPARKDTLHFLNHMKKSLGTLMNHPGLSDLFGFGGASTLCMAFFACSLAIGNCVALRADNAF
jgi:integrase